MLTYCVISQLYKDVVTSIMIEMTLTVFNTILMWAMKLLFDNSIIRYMDKGLCKKVGHYS